MRCLGPTWQRKWMDAYKLSTDIHTCAAVPLSGTHNRWKRNKVTKAGAVENTCNPRSWLEQRLGYAGRLPQKRKRVGEGEKELSVMWSINGSFNILIHTCATQRVLTQQYLCNHYFLNSPFCLPCSIVLTFVINHTHIHTHHVHGSVSELYFGFYCCAVLSWFGWFWDSKVLQCSPGWPQNCNGSTPLSPKFSH